MVARRKTGSREDGELLVQAPSIGSFVNEVTVATSGPHVMHWCHRTLNKLVRDEVEKR